MTRETGRKTSSGSALQVKEEDDEEQKEKEEAEALDKELRHWWNKSVCRYFAGPVKCKWGESCKFIHSSWKVQASDLRPPA